MFFLDWTNSKTFILMKDPIVFNDGNTFEKNSQPYH